METQCGYAPAKSPAQSVSAGIDFRLLALTGRATVNTMVMSALALFLLGVALVLSTMATPVPTYHLGFVVVDPVCHAVACPRMQATAPMQRVRGVRAVLQEREAD